MAVVIATALIKANIFVLLNPGFVSIQQCGKYNQFTNRSCIIVLFIVPCSPCFLSYLFASTSGFIVFLNPELHGPPDVAS
jgi:hypothetical protein